jgi:hypothetical protein
MPYAKISVLCEQMTAYSRTSREQVSCHKHKHTHVAVSEMALTLETRCAEIRLVIAYSETLELTAEPTSSLEEWASYFSTAYLLYSAEGSNCITHILLTL